MHIPEKLINNAIDVDNKNTPLSKTAKIFNNFLLHQQIISTVTEYSVIAERVKDYDTWQAILIALFTAKKSELFFKLTQTISNIPLAVLVQVAKKLIAGELSELLNLTLEGLSSYYYKVQALFFLDQTRKNNLIDSFITAPEATKVRIDSICELVAVINNFQFSEPIIKNQFLFNMFNESQDQPEKILQLKDNLDKFYGLTVSVSWLKPEKQFELICHCLNDTSTFNNIISNLERFHNITRQSQLDQSIRLETAKKFINNAANFAFFNDKIERLTISVQANTFFQPSTKKTIINHFFENSQDINDVLLALSDADKKSSGLISNLCSQQTLTAIATFIETNIDDKATLLAYFTELTKFIDTIHSVESSISITNDVNNMADKKQQAFTHLYDQFMVAKTINNPTQLEIAAKITVTALNLCAQNHISELFSTVVDSNTSVSNQQQRQSILQYLHHNLLNLDEDFKKSYYDYYQFFAQSLFDVLDLKPSKCSSKADHKRLIQSTTFQYAKIMAFTQELANAIRSPWDDSLSPVQPAAGNLTPTDYASYFSQQKNNYQSCFFVNQVRSTQAKKFFSDINVVINQNKYSHQQILSTILTTQQAILVSDASAKHNTKGYSRLYDLTMQIFFKVAIDCLKSDKVTVEDKAQISTLVAEQRAIVLAQIKSRTNAPSKETRYLHDALGCLSSDGLLTTTYSA